MQERRTDQAISDTDVRAAWLRTCVIAAVVTALDQLTKSWAEANFFDEPRRVAGQLQFTLVYNDGVAFGLGSGALPLVLALVVLVAVVLMLGRNITVNRPTMVGAGLVIGGALGNVFDRVFRDRGGAVIDFIDVGRLPLIGPWPVFNLADVAVVSGAILLAVWGTRKAAT